MRGPYSFARASSTELLWPRGADKVIEAYAADAIEPGESIVVSFVGDTPIEGRHIHAEPGRRYDWRCLRRLFAFIVVRPGQDVAHSVRAIFETSNLYPTIVDLERQVVGSIVDGSGRVWPRRRGSEPWLALFG